MTPMPRAAVTVSVPGTPVAWARPLRPNGVAVTPPKMKAAKEALRWAFKEKCSEPLEGPLILLVAFAFEPPKRWRKTERQAVKDGARPGHYIKPDLDNLLKLCLDAGNGILWNDDAQVVSVDACKCYADEAETWLTVFCDPYS